MCAAVNTFLYVRLQAAVSSAVPFCCIPLQTWSNGDRTLGHTQRAENLMAQKVGVLLSRNSGDYLLACGLHCSVSLCRLTKPIERFQEKATFMCMKRRSFLRTSAAFIGASLLA